MALAFRLSAQLGLCDAALAPRVERHLAANGMPARLADVDGAAGFATGRLLDHMRQDKKVRDGRLVFILAEAIGRAVQRDDVAPARSEEHTSELQSLMRISYAVFCWKKKQIKIE